MFSIISNFSRQHRHFHLVQKVVLIYPYLCIILLHTNLLVQEIRVSVAGLFYFLESKSLNYINPISDKFPKFRSSFFLFWTELINLRSLISFSHSLFRSSSQAHESHGAIGSAELTAEFRSRHFLIGLILADLASVLDTSNTLLHSRLVISPFKLVLI